MAVAGWNADEGGERGMQCRKYDNRGVPTSRAKLGAGCVDRILRGSDRRALTSNDRDAAVSAAAVAAD